MPRNNFGFTLMEMLVTVLLIAILSMIGFPQYTRVVEKQRANEASFTLNAIAKAEERYYAINEEYTSDYSLLDVDLTDVDKKRPSGSMYNATYFTFALNVGATNPGITATRKGGTYTLSKCLDSGDLCCEANDEYLCDNLDIDACTADAC